jgi:hypothetical protein
VANAKIAEDSEVLTFALKRTEAIERYGFAMLDKSMPKAVRTIY